MKKVKLIYNSGAGQSKFQYFLDSIIEKFMENDFEVSVFRAAENTNLYEFLKDAEKENVYGIVVAGGDGTINRVVNVMMKNDIKIPLGIIPAGTSNDFAKHIKMPNNFSECISKIFAGNIQQVDVGLVNDKYFINVCSAGLFSNASQQVDSGLKNALGKISYVVSAANQMAKFKPFQIKVETSTDILIEKVTLFLVFNGSSAGGLDKLGGNSSIQDGMLDLVIVKECGIAETSVLFGKALAGTHLDDKNIIHIQDNYFKINKIKGKCDKPDVDGDEGPNFPLEIKCIQNGISMFL